VLADDAQGEWQATGDGDQLDRRVLLRGDTTGAPQRERHHPVGGAVVRSRKNLLVGRTLHHANRPATAHGDPLPGHLTSSRHQWRGGVNY
jgi:hypothetical protein